MPKSILIALMLLSLPTATLAQDAQTEPATETPKPPAPGEPLADDPPQPAAFAARAAAANLFEIQSAELALRRSKEAFVLDYAKQLLTDHRKAQAELEAAAKSQTAAFRPELDDDLTEKLAALASASDADFDAAFLSAQMVAHQSTIELFALYAGKGQRGPLKAHAQAQYPTLHTHFLKAHAGAPD